MTTSRKLGLNYSTNVALRVSIPVSMASHGFNNDYVYNNGTTWLKAQANSASTIATHFAINVDTNNFIAVSSGEIDTGSITDDLSNALVVGSYYFLSQTVSGKVHKIEYTSGLGQCV